MDKLVTEPQTVLGIQCTSEVAERFERFLEVWVLPWMPRCARETHPTYPTTSIGSLQQLFRFRCSGYPLRVPARIRNVEGPTARILYSYAARILYSYDAPLL